MPHPGGGFSYTEPAEEGVMHWLRKASALTGALLLRREKIYAKKCFYYLYVNVIFNCRQHIPQHPSGWLWSAISAHIILEGSENYVSGHFPQEKVKF